MSKNILLNETEYNGVSTVQLTTTDGGTATFKDTGEITTPRGTKTITSNGTHDVTDFAQAYVNVQNEISEADSFETITIDTDCSTMGEVWEVFNSKGLINNGRKVFVLKNSSDDVTNKVICCATKSGTANGLMITIWRTSSLKTAVEVGNTNTVTAIINAGAEFYVIEY